MFHELRRALGSPILPIDLSSVVVPHDFTDAHALDFLHAQKEFLFVQKPDAQPLLPSLSLNALGLADGVKSISIPLGRKHRAEFEWFFQNFVAWPIQHRDFRRSRIWRPAVNRARATQYVRAFAQTGKLHFLSPLIYEPGLLDDEACAWIIDALPRRYDVSRESVEAILRAHDAKAPGVTFDAIANLKKRKLSKGGRRSRAICLGPTEKQKKNWHLTLERETRNSRQSIDALADRIARVLAYSKLQTT